MAKFGPRKAVVLLLVPVGCLLGGSAGIRLNTSASLPLGFYVRTESESAPLVEFCPEEPYASLSRQRGYRAPAGSCADWAMPLLKPVIARPGDLVTISAKGIAVNGTLLPNTAPLMTDAAGRALTAWPQGVYPVRPGTVWVASTYSRGSYDSRYMGPVNTRLIRGKLRPLWLLQG